MRFLLVTLVLPAFAQDSPDAEQLFRKMEKQLAVAKTLQFQFETTLEGGLEKGAKIKGSFVLGEANKLRLVVDGEFDGKPMKGELASNGTKIRAVASYAKEPREHDTPANLGDVLKLMTGRAGVFFAFEAVEYIVAGSKDKDKTLPPHKLFAVSDFKLGAKSKVGDRAAQIVTYAMTVAGSELTTYVTLWIDSETHLPLRRIITDKKGSQGFQVAETYTGFRIDAKVDAKLFELPSK